MSSLWVTILTVVLLRSVRASPEPDEHADVEHGPGEPVYAR
jgi:hypothetical protein